VLEHLEVVLGDLGERNHDGLHPGVIEIARLTHHQLLGAHHVEHQNSVLLLAPQVAKQSFKIHRIDRGSFDVEIAVQLIRRVDERERQRGAKVIRSDFFFGKELHLVAGQIVGIDEEVALEVFQALEIDDLFDPGRMGAQPEAAGVETARAQAGKGERPPVGHVALDPRIGEPERGESPEPLPVNVGGQAGLVEHLEVHRKAVVDLVRYAHRDGVLERLLALAGACYGRCVQ
jgi:hypothetical protein